MVATLEPGQDVLHGFNVMVRSEAVRRENLSQRGGKYYKRQDKEEAALEMFQNIADLEEDYDVQLQTDADERRIEQLT